MPLRTYIPHLIFIVRVVCRYTQRYDTQIRSNLDGAALTAYSALRVACDAFVTVAPIAPIGD